MTTRHIMCARLLPLLRRFLHRPYGALPRSRGLQGGGVNVYIYGVANFEGCNIHDNTAYNVCLHVERSLNFYPSPLYGA